MARYGRLIKVVLISILVYRSITPLPPGPKHSVGAQVVTNALTFCDFLGALTYKIGLPRWAFVKGLFKYAPVPSIPDDVTVKIVRLGNVTTHLLYPNGFMGRAKNQSAIIHYHGGGFVSGTPEFYYPVAGDMIKNLDLLVAIVDYRLAPEHPFPVPFEDSLEAANQLMLRHAEFNIDKNKIVITGDSAGGNLATAVALETTRPSAMLAAIYPMLQCVDFTLPSYEQNVKQPVVAIESAASSWLTYMGFERKLSLVNSFLYGYHVQNQNAAIKKILSRVDKTMIPDRFSKRQRFEREFPRKRVRDLMKPYKSEIAKLSTNHKLAPLMASDEQLRKLPPTHVLTCEYDPLRDDGVLFAERLRALNKRVTLQNLDHGYHAILNTAVMYNDEYARQEINKLYSSIRKQLTIEHTTTLNS